MTTVTYILNQIDRGDPSAADQLLPLVYDELRQLAAARLKQEKPGQTLQATALVHEAYLRLVGNGQDHHWNSRGHFFAAAAEAIRRILVERARRKTREKHGGNLKRIDLADILIPAEIPPQQLIALDEALEEFSKIEPFKTKLINLRFFAGLSNDDAARLLGISPATAKRNWRYARAWLHAKISDQDDLLNFPDLNRQVSQII